MRLLRGCWLSVWRLPKGRVDNTVVYWVRVAIVAFVKGCTGSAVVAWVDGVIVAFAAGFVVGAVVSSY